MRTLTFAGLLALSCCAFSQTLRPRNYDTYDYYALHLNHSTPPEQIALYLGLELEGQLGELEDHYLLRSPRRNYNIVQEVLKEHRTRKRRRDGSYQNSLLDGVILHQKQKLKPRMVKRISTLPPLLLSRQGSSPGQNDGSGKAIIPPADPAVAKGIEIASALNITDPIFHDQWHLHNSVQPGHDLNVSGVWMQGITGKNTTVCIIDDGLDMDSEDLKANYFAEGSYDFNEHVDEPKPRLLDDRHGTRCAGEVSAVKNNVCGVGVAWDSKIAGIRILSKAISDADEAIAVNYAFQKTQIYSCSWGPPDDGQEMGAPGVLIRRAMVTAVQKGRGGLGSIYVFAAGNGALQDDNCNFDGYTNSIYTIAIGGIDRKDLHPYYSEKCSAQLAVTYSSGSGGFIHTTDVGADQCYTSHGGTSAAGPLAAGIFALVLQIRPDLTWRDIQWLTVLTAVQIDQPSDWQNTKLGKYYSHQFGYGKLDAWAIVEAAKNFTSVKPQAWYSSPWQHVRHAIPQGHLGLSSTYHVNASGLVEANLEVVEHVTVTMNIEHTRRGDLSVELQSPARIVSHLSTARRNDGARAGYSDWTFMSVAHWGEVGEGTWTIIVKDTVENEHTGVFVDWKLTLFGECIDPTTQGLLPLPTEHDDDEHDREDTIVSTTSLLVPANSEDPTANPTDHIERPVNFKPVDATASAMVTTTAGIGAPIVASETAFATSTISPSGTFTSESSATATSFPDSFLPSPFPTFGVSKRTQIWIYAATVLILIFCCSLAIYFCLARRKRQRLLARENYEFEMLEEDDDDRHKGANGTTGGRKGKRRARELYDAFQPGESDEEVFDDDDDQYRDEVAGVNEKRRAGLSDRHSGDYR